MFKVFSRQNFAPPTEDVVSDETLSVLITDALTRTRRLPYFDPRLSISYEADTRVRRVRHIRRMILLGLCFFSLYDISGFVTAPNFGWLNAGLRGLVMTPTALLICYVIDKVEGRTREAIVAMGMLGAASIPLLLFCLSDEPLAPLLTVEVLLSVIYANTTLALRFEWACLVSAVMSVGVVGGLYFKPHLGPGLSAVLLLNLVTGLIYGLAANLRIDWSERRAYLLTLQEALRVRSLRDDNRALTRLSSTDALTGLFNRRFLDDSAQTLDRDLIRGRQLAVILIDVDHFKRFNDFYGHEAGDNCLRRLADMFLHDPGAEGRFAVRLGGEEFVIILPDQSIANAAAIAERLRLGVEALSIFHAARSDARSIVTISVGVAGATATPTTITALIKDADAALYAAKSRGRNRVCLASETGDRSHPAPGGTMALSQ